MGEGVACDHFVSHVHSNVQKSGMGREAGRTTYVVREIGVHEHDKGTLDELEGINISRAKSLLAFSLQNADSALENLLQMQGDRHRSVWGGILDNEQLILDATAAIFTKHQ